MTLVCTAAISPASLVLAPILRYFPLTRRKALEVPSGLRGAFLVCGQARVRLPGQLRGGLGAASGLKRKRGT